MQNSLLIILLIGVAVAKNYKHAIDISTKITSTQANCLKNEKIDGIIIRAFTALGGGTFDFNACDSYRTAIEAGLDVMIYVVPYVSKDNANGDEQFKALSKSLKADNCGMKDEKFIWLQVVNATNWVTSDPNMNIAFIKSFVGAAEAEGYEVGIFTNMVDWKLITLDSDQNCISDSGKDHKLWYSTTGGENFSDFAEFNGWNISLVDAKMYSQNVNHYCKVQCNLDIYNRAFE